MQLVHGILVAYDERKNQIKQMQCNAISEMTENILSKMRFNLGFNKKKQRKTAKELKIWQFFHFDLGLVDSFSFPFQQDSQIVMIIITHTKRYSRLMYM